MIAASVTVALADQTYTITVKNGYKGETYTAYKIFDVVYSGTNYAYSINNTGEWWSAIVGSTAADSNGDYTLSAYGIKFQHTTDANVFAVVNAVDGTNPTTAQMAKLAEDLAKVDLTGKTAAGSGSVAKAEGDAYGAKADVTINVNPDVAGYYFVKTTTGALCALNTTDTNAEVQEKNQIPDIDKKQAIDAAPETAAGYVDADLDVQVGDTVYYQIEVSDGKGTDAEIVVTDTMGTGLAFDTTTDPVITASINGAAEATVDPTNYSITNKTAVGFVVTFNAAYVKTLTENDKLYIRFTATVTDAAYTVNYERNTASIDYSNQHKEDHVDVKPYKFQLDKTDGEYTDLLGAKFELYRGSNAAANKIYFVKGTAENGIPVLQVVPSTTTGAFSEIELTEGTTGNSLNSSKVIIKGLDKDTYILHETKAPDGYNELKEDRTVAATTLVAIDGTITDAEGIANDVGVVTVVNETGIELPSTGGIGTTLFYVGGGILVLLAIVMLVTKKRMKAED